MATGGAAAAAEPPPSRQDRQRRCRWARRHQRHRRWWRRRWLRRQRRGVAGSPGQPGNSPGNGQGGTGGSRPQRRRQRRPVQRHRAGRLGRERRLRETAAAACPPNTDDSRDRYHGGNLKGRLYLAVDDVGDDARTATPPKKPGPAHRRRTSARHEARAARGAARAAVPDRSRPTTDNDRASFMTSRLLSTGGVYVVADSRAKCRQTASLHGAAALPPECDVTATRVGAIRHPKPPEPSTHSQLRSHSAGEGLGVRDGPRGPSRGGSTSYAYRARVKTVGLRELRQNASELVRRAGKGRRSPSPWPAAPRHDSFRRPPALGGAGPTCPNCSQVPQIPRGVPTVRQSPRKYETRG